MELYLIRHGETESNLERRYQGWSESPLSEKGLRQAEQVAQFLAAERIEAVYCSDLKRAIHTARVIGVGSGREPEITPLLREIHFGEWEGLTFDEIEASWGERISAWLDNPFERSAPGGETLKEVCGRMHSFVEHLKACHAESRRVAAVSHGGSIRALLYQVLSLDLESFWKIKIDNASVSLFHNQSNGLKVVYYNRVHHLGSGVFEKRDPDGL